MFSKDTFCIMPWSSLTVEPTGNYKVCMFTQAGDVADSTGAVQHVLTHSVEDAMNSSLHREIRLAQSRGEKHPNCSMCWNKDAANTASGFEKGHSVRKYKSFMQLPDFDGVVNFNNVDQYLTEDGSLISPQPISLDLRFTNVCNLKCVMCYPMYSNQWYEDYVKLYNTDKCSFDGSEHKITIYKENGVYKSDMVAWHDSEIWWGKFEQIKHQVRHIYLTGGEPFLVKGHDRLLESLIEGDCAKNVVLDYDTNLTVYNDNILGKLKQFKQVNFAVSMDDVESQYELVRFPGKFDRVVGNLDKLLTDGFTVKYISACIGIYSLFAPIRLYKYFLADKKYFSYKNPLSLKMVFLQGPDHMNIAYLPRELKLKVIEIYNNADVSDNIRKQVVGYLNSNLDMSQDKCNKKLQAHILYMDKLDAIRGTNWRNTFPEIVDLLADYL